MFSTACKRSIELPVTTHAAVRSQRCASSSDALLACFYRWVSENPVLQIFSIRETVDRFVAT